MAIADEALLEIGFETPEKPPASSLFRDLYFMQHVGMALTKEIPAGALFPYAPTSLCREVPPAIACVQPKTRTPQVGCTLRSLSHHVALLPPSSDVTTRWEMAGLKASDHLNVLLVPFPYHVDGRCFEDAGPCFADADEPPMRTHRYFRTRQLWIADAGGVSGAPDAAVLASFIKRLVEKTNAEAERVDFVILPEAALTASAADQVAADLAASAVHPSLFVSGVCTSENAAERNQVRSYVLENGKIGTGWTQNKHHRWKVERSQIERYHLAGALAPEYSWWEHIEVGERACWVYAVQPNVTVATLICEDLARVDPVQVAMRSMGPNLVIALLMDGPQWERRWPGKYAAALASKRLGFDLSQIYGAAGNKAPKSRKKKDRKASRFEQEEGREEGASSLGRPSGTCPTAQ